MALTVSRTAVVLCPSVCASTGVRAGVPSHVDYRWCTHCLPGTGGGCWESGTDGSVWGCPQASGPIVWLLLCTVCFILVLSLPSLLCAQHALAAAQSFLFWAQAQSVVCLWRWAVLTCSSYCHARLSFYCSLKARDALILQSNKASPSSVKGTWRTSQVLRYSTFWVVQAILQY